MPVHTRPPEAVSITLPMPVEIEEKKNRADRKWEIISAVSVGSRRPDATTALLPCTPCILHEICHCNTSQTNVTQTPRQIPMVAIWVSLFIRFEHFHTEDSD